MKPRTRRPVPARAIALTAVLATVAVLSGCAGSDDPRPDAAPDRASSAPVDDTAGLPMVPPEAGHVHGMAVNPADGLLYLGTHVGTLVVDGDTVAQVGDSTIDLMGFTAAGSDHFYASGHPGPADDLPDPVGLIESTDGGQTWTPLSLTGESDFHTLGAAGERVYGFNGQLMGTTNGTDWTLGATDVAPASLAVDPQDPDHVVATTEHGPARSTDAGETFTHLEGAPLLLFVAWPAPTELWGVSPEGDVYVSPDAGETWEARGTVDAPSALAAGVDGSVVVATDSAIVSSEDGGTTFRAIAELSGSGH